MGSDGQRCSSSPPRGATGSARRWSFARTRIPHSRRGSVKRVRPSARCSASSSGLYFRGKLTYSRMFGRVLVITPGPRAARRGRDPDARRLARDRGDRITSEDPRFREPLERDAVELGARLDGADRVVLLGSIANGKYVGPDRAPSRREALFPRRSWTRRHEPRRAPPPLPCVDRHELDTSDRGAVRRGPRPPRLTPLR